MFWPESQGASRTSSTPRGVFESELGARHTKMIQDPHRAGHYRGGGGSQGGLGRTHTGTQRGRLWMA